MRLRVVIVVAALVFGGTLEARATGAAGPAGDGAARWRTSRRSLLPVPSADVPLNSTEGAALLREASHALPWRQLSLHFETQRNQAFCSAATAVTILNALSADGLAAGTSQPPPRAPLAHQNAFERIS